MQHRHRVDQQFNPRLIVPRVVINIGPGHEPPFGMSPVLKLTNWPLTAVGAGRAETNLKPAANASTIVAMAESLGP